MFPNIPTKVIKDSCDAYKMSLKSIWNSAKCYKKYCFLQSLKLTGSKPVYKKYPNLVEN